MEVEVHDPVLMPSSECPRCKRKRNMVTGLMSKQPEEGDINICVYCGKIMIFTADNYLRDTSTEEIAEIKRRLLEENPEHWDLIVKSSRFFESERARREN